VTRVTLVITAVTRVTLVITAVTRVTLVITAVTRVTLVITAVIIAGEEPMTEQQLMEIVDGVLRDDDGNGDGFVSFYEFTSSRRDNS